MPKSKKTNIEKERLPQAAQHLLMEIGEKQVLFRLLVLIQDKGWEAYQGLNDSGCDIVLINKKDFSKIKIEVKTRQKIHSNAKNQSHVLFNLTENEYRNCDFLVGYWLEENAFFILPKIELNVVLVKGKKQYRFRAYKDKNDQFNKMSKTFLNKWEFILDLMDSLIQ